MPMRGLELHDKFLCEPNMEDIIITFGENTHNMKKKALYTVIYECHIQNKCEYEDMETLGKFR